MRNSLLVKQVTPFVLWYLLLILATLVIDFILHMLDLFWIGRYLGPLGTLIIISSFGYSARKHKHMPKGPSTKFLLEAHEYLGWIGALMVAVHAGIHFNALIPWLATLFMLVVLASGLTGKYLLITAREGLKERQTELKNQGITGEELERQLFLDSLTVDVIKKWRLIHFPITTIFATLSILHILSIIILW
ncbi:MAG: hypothetical protein HGB11_05065 [Chlorobiales bacterium]|nr:hypothetical protein [Chlorobiales bacterium]